MRWTNPKRGDLRHKSGFLFFPKGKDEIRWLEYAKWTESYVGYGSWVFMWWNDGEDE